MQGCKILIHFFLFSAILVTLGCHPRPPAQPTVYDQIHSTLEKSIQEDAKKSKKKSYAAVPRSVSNALLPSMESESAAPVNPEHRFDVVANKMPARTFFMGLVEGTPYNMVVSPDVTGTVSLNLKNVTIHQTLQAVHDVYGYEFHRTSYGYEVLPATLETQIFNVNYIDVKRTGKSFTQLSSAQLNEVVGTFNAGTQQGSTPTSTNPVTQVPSSSTVDTRSEMNFWASLNVTLKNIIGSAEGRSVIVNPQGSVVIVHALPSELHQVAHYLDRLQSNLGRQVILEAKILEVQLNDQFQSGIDWNLLGKTTNPDGSLNGGGVSQNGLIIFPNTGLNDFNSMFTLSVQGQFGTLIKLLQTQGNVQVLSSPRISTVNNQKAVIKVGQDEFFVTGVSTSNTVVGSATIPSQDVSLTPFFSGITLDVTPQISSKGSVILHIHPSVSTVKDQEKHISLGTTVNNTPNILSLPLALSTIRESDNIVRAQNGQVVVIGGLMQNTMQEDTAGIPGLSKAPFFGALFRTTNQVSNKTELVILLRPIIIERKSLEDDLEETNENFEHLKRGFHVGGLPEIFGTEGERRVADTTSYSNQSESAYK